MFESIATYFKSVMWKFWRRRENINNCWILRKLSKQTFLWFSFSIKILLYHNLLSSLSSGVLKNYNIMFTFSWYFIISRLTFIQLQGLFWINFKETKQSYKRVEDRNDLYNSWNPFWIDYFHQSSTKDLTQKKKMLWMWWRYFAY